jgi:hypothetical protein
LFNTHKFGSGDFSFEVYVSTGYSSDTNLIISNYNGLPTPYRSLGFTATGAVVTVMYDGTNTFLVGGSTTGLNDGELHHIVVSRIGQTAYLYVDGSLDNSGTNSNLGTTDSTSSEWIGREPTEVYPFDGVIKYVSIYDRGLTAADVAFKNSNHYVQSGLDSDGNIYHVPGLIGRWRFDKGTDGVYGDGTLVNDDSGLSPDGKMYNFQSDPWVEL